MAQGSNWRKQLGFWMALFVVTAVGTSVGLKWLNGQSSPPPLPSPQGPAPSPGAETPVPAPGAPPPASSSSPSLPPPTAGSSGGASSSPHTLAWAEAKPGTAYDQATNLPQEVVDKQTQIELVLIKPGTYERGLTFPPDRRHRFEDETPAHQVTISRPFYLGKHEVTQGQWKKVMGENPSRFNKGDDFPVENVAATEVQVFLKKTNFRLPTEAEWEYVCKAGGRDPLESELVDLQGMLDSIAWYQRNSGRSTQPVGLKKANAFGLTDMLGNVSEWTGSWYDSAEYYRSVPSVTDPKGPQQGEEIVVRGCTYQSAEEDCRCSSRTHQHPRSRYATGFRVAHDVDEESTREK